MCVCVFGVYMCVSFFSSLNEASTALLVASQHTLFQAAEHVGVLYFAGIGVDEVCVPACLCACV